jgi:hypothetical protein
MIQWLKDNVDNLYFNNDYKVSKYPSHFNDLLLILHIIDNLGIFVWHLWYDTKEEKFDKNYNKIKTYHLHSLILYKEKVTITNDLGKAHLMYEVFTKFKLSCNGERIQINENPLISRTYLSDKEVSNGYFHSHCTTVDNFGEQDKPTFKGFCLGSSEFKGVLAEFNTRTTINREKNIILYKKFFMQWLSSLCCESDEGRPYKRLLDINYTLQGGENCNVPTKIVKEFTERMIEFSDTRRFGLELKFNLVDNKIQIANIDEIRNLLNEHKNLFNDEDLIKFYAVYNQGLEYTIKPFVEKMEDKLCTVPLVFRGEEFYQRMYKLDEYETMRELILNSSVYISNRLLNKFKQETENKLNLYNILKNGK